MIIEIENPIDLLLEFSYINGVMHNISVKDYPAMDNINKIVEQIRSNLK